MSRAQATATAADQLAYVWKRPIDNEPFTADTIRDLIAQRWPDLHAAIETVVAARTDTADTTKAGAA